MLLTPAKADFIVGKQALKAGHKENLERLYKELLNKDWFMTLLDLEDSPTRSLISTFAPSDVPSVTAPFNIYFILPVPDASLEAREIR